MIYSAIEELKQNTVVAGGVARPEGHRGVQAPQGPNRVMVTLRLERMWVSSSTVSAQHRAAARPRLPRRVRARGFRRARHLHECGVRSVISIPLIDTDKIDSIQGQ